MFTVIQNQNKGRDACSMHFSCLYVRVLLEKVAKSERKQYRVGVHLYIVLVFMVETIPCIIFVPLQNCLSLRSLVSQVEQ